MSRRFISLLKWASILLIFTVTAALAVPYSAIVIDAENGEVLYEDNADEFSHPAGLTKLMTLYAAFDAVETGLIGLDDKVLISLKASHEPPVKIGLREGQNIKSNICSEQRVLAEQMMHLQQSQRPSMVQKKRLRLE